MRSAYDLVKIKGTKATVKFFLLLGFVTIGRYSSDMEHLVTLSKRSYHQKQTLPVCAAHRTCSRLSMRGIAILYKKSLHLLLMYLEDSSD